MIAIKKIAACAQLTGATALFCLNAHAALPIEHWQLPGGAQVYLVSTQALPIVDVQIDFDAGSRRDPPVQAGLASVTAGMVEKGVRASGCAPAAAAPAPEAGRAVSAAAPVAPAAPVALTTAPCEPALDQNALGEAWADLGAMFGVGAGMDRMSFTLRTLAQPALLDKAVALAAREIGEPAFPEDVWQRERERIGAALKEANTKPGTIAGRRFAQAVYGSHPYGQQTTEATLARIDVADMRRRYAQGVVPCRAKVSIVGAVTRAQAERIATTLLSRLPATVEAAARCEPAPPVAEVAALGAPVEERIPFDAAQAHVLIGQPGYPYRDPDRFALNVGNYVLGGGSLVSRLTEEVREKRGLAYSVYSAFSPGLHGGAFRIYFQTRPDQADEALKVAREVLARYVAEGPTPAEVKAAKDNLIGGFPLLIDSNRDLLGNVANIAWNDLPLDYLDTWTKRMAAVTVADVKAALARKLQPQRMVTVIVGAKP